MLGALDSTGDVTETGRMMSHFPLEPFLSRMLIEAGRNRLNCVKEITIIVAMASVENVFENKKSVRKKPGAAPPSILGASKVVVKANSAYNQHMNVTSASSSSSRCGQDEETVLRNKQIDESHAQLRHPLGDMWTSLVIYKKWEETGYSHQWCDDFFLHYRAMKTAKNVREQLLDECIKHGLCAATDKSSGASTSSHSSNLFTPAYEERIGRVLAASLYMNVAR